MTNEELIKKGYIHIDDVYRLIAGHSNYHGDNILSALTCIAEGKNVTKPITPLDEKEKTWKWIDDEFGSKCSYCGRYTHLDKFDRPMKFMYCSMCGAKMEVNE